MSSTGRLHKIALGVSIVGTDTVAEYEQSLAIRELLESNCFTPVGHEGGPYRLLLDVIDGRLCVHIEDDDGVHVVSHHLSMTPFRRLFKDYSRLCTSYFDAVRRFCPDHLQAIDMGRRGLHNEAAELLRERLSTKVHVDLETARRLFTLIYALFSRSNTYSSSLDWK